MAEPARRLTVINSSNRELMSDELDSVNGGRNPDDFCCGGPTKPNQGGMGGGGLGGQILGGIKSVAKTIAGIFGL
jgi:hypothetical protein